MRKDGLIAIIAIPVLIAIINVASAQQYHKIMLFGGRAHNIYLGCLNCDKSAPDSIFNEFGPYGHCPGPFSDNIYCRGSFKEFGSTGLFHDQSACGDNPTDPPVIVDEQGSYYGRFSLGGAFGHRDSICSLLSRFYNSDSCEIVKWVCDDNRKQTDANKDNQNDDEDEDDDDDD